MSEKEFYIENGALKKYVNCNNKKDVVIPEGVVELDWGAFEHCSAVVNVTIPKGVVKIGFAAFRGCKNLESVSIPDTVVYIDGHAFSFCPKLKSITIPDSVCHIDKCAFKDCSQLESVTLSNNIRVIDGSAFNGCSSLSSIILPQKITVIGDYAFARTGLKEIDIPQSVMSIQRNAFSDCTALTAINIPAKVNDIGIGILAGCSSLKQIIVAEGNEKYYSIDNCIIERQSKRLIAGCITSIIPSDGQVDKIGEDAFSGQTELVDFEVGPEIKAIEDSAFRGCSNLKKITLSEGLLSISYSAFYGCKSLSKIVIPKTVEEIRSSAFKKCDELVCYGLKEEKDYKYFCLDAFEGDRLDVVPFHFLDDPCNKRGCVVLWLKGEHRRPEDEGELLSYIKKQKNKLISYVAEYGNAETFEKFIRLFDNPVFAEKDVNAALKVSEQDESLHAAIEAYKQELIISNRLKPRDNSAPGTEKDPENLSKEDSIGKKSKTGKEPVREDTQKDYETVKFGRYMIDDENDLESLTWRVLSKESGKVLLITEKLIDVKRFSAVEDNSWKRSDLRKWLNDSFTNIAFNEEEKEKIVEVVPGDKVFLLSTDEFFRYFKNYKDARAEYTEYAKKLHRKVFCRKADTYGFWWLRSAPENTYEYVWHVINKGTLNGFCRTTYEDFVRPAVWVKYE